MSTAAECMIPARVAQRSTELLAAIERMILGQLPEDVLPMPRQMPRTRMYFPQMKVRGGRRRHGQRSTQQANRYANGGVVWIDEAYR
ncbi:hypothetical protein SAMN04488550_4143 [Gordonia malaquae]|uniref:Uncharacterized protein n=1 Tax=Gordonia malaquae NBRC 108250 TaxID=1223542 RepID=M3VC19_GORML|nr:hypothetical protein [Gordonia malaquae]GAC81243.1 hypothetical protein GM1_030_00720 [Gordonia malaquae NBRC 108250]SEE24984.1 hypothetical protein SAMN04488550_4143 [Gordonia malaquae]